MKHLLFLLISFVVFDANAAVINSFTKNTEINFGQIRQGSAVGSIQSDGAGGTGGVVCLSNCTDGSFSIQSTNSGSSAEGKSIFIATTFPSSIVNGGATMNSAITFDVSAFGVNCTVSGDKITCVDPNGGVGESWNFPLKGVLSNIASTQANGNYSGPYSITACSCCIANDPSGCPKKGCPNSASDNNGRCSAPWGITLSGIIQSSVIQPLSITETAALNFGWIGELGSGGTVNQAGSTTGSVVAMSGGTLSAGILSVTGEPNMNYLVSIPTSIFITNGSRSMNVDLSVVGGASRIINGAGSDTLTINGILTVDAGQREGDYSGTYNVTINY